MNERAQDFQIFVKPVSYRCNLSCSYCYYLPKKRMFGRYVDILTMSDDMLERYVRQHLAAHPGPEVTFSWHGGEPTLFGLDGFRRIVELQKKHCPAGKRIVNGMQTNGTLIDEEWALFLREHHFSVGISIDGPQELHELYRNSRGCSTFHDVLRGYDLLKRNGVHVDVLCVVNNENVLYPLQVYRFFKMIGATHIGFLPLVEREGNAVSKKSVDPEEFGAFLCTIFDEWVAGDIGSIKVQIFEEALRCAFRQPHSLCLFRPHCGEIPVVEYNGDVYACDHFVDHENYIGNILEDDLFPLLLSEKLQLFGLEKARLTRKCLACDVLDMCNGECPKNRFVDLPGEDFRQNYLCEGYRLFFRHCRPFVEEVARQWRKDHGAL